MKIFTARQTQELDKVTIKKDGITSFELMQRASAVFSDWFVENFPSTESIINIFCGTGNNGGDGLVVANNLLLADYSVNVFLCKIGAKQSEDNLHALKLLERKFKKHISVINDGDPLPSLASNTIIIDAIFGSGLTRAVTGYWAQLIEYLNEYKSERIAIDIPSGLRMDKNSDGSIIRATKTLSFEMPKLAMLLPQNHQYLGDWKVKSIGLHLGTMRQTKTAVEYLDAGMIRPLLKTRAKYDHKGTFGHALIVAGAYGTVGAAILAGKAALRTGCGLLTIHSAKIAYPILQMALPEAMVHMDAHKYKLSEIPELTGFSALGIGCGIGTNELSQNALLELLEKIEIPLVMDADALNIMALNPSWMQKIPQHTILTPHPKEFERLFGKTANHFERLELVQTLSAKYNIYIVLKGANTLISSPDGRCFFNSTGNPGMATAGSGDVLTGMITSLLAQGYSTLDAALVGTYLHGLAGDIAMKELEQEALLAGDIIEHIGKAYKTIRSTEGA